MPRSLAAVFLSGAVAACSSASPTPPPLQPALPGPGTDASFVGVYEGGASWAASATGAADAGAPLPPSGAEAEEIAITSADGAIDDLSVKMGSCVLRATVTARRYDEASRTQSPLTLASAHFDPQQTCTLPIVGGIADLAIDESRLTLFADGALEVVMSGSANTAAPDLEPSYVTYTFEGQKAEVTCTGAPLPEEPPTMCASAGGPLTSISFQNVCTLRVISLYWIDDTCREVHAADLSPGAHYVAPAPYARAWRVRDAATHVLLREIPPVTTDASMLMVP